MKLFINLQYDFEYNGFVAECPALPGCMSQGKTKEEALKNIKEAARGYVKTLKEHHQTTPLEAVGSNFVEIKI
jgi:predicted RNase H-like HicB family nuclease